MAAAEPPASEAAPSSNGSKKSSLQPIGSFVRIKPEHADQAGGVASLKRLASWDDDKIEIEIGGRNGTTRKVFDYPTATLPPESSQTEVYETVAAPLVEQFVEGFDVDLICYGQTGSGKTYTMFGPPHRYACTMLGPPRPPRRPRNVSVPSCECDRVHHARPASHVLVRSHS